MRAVDRALGGQEPPSRLQRWAARHPVRAGLWAGVPFGVFFAVIGPGEAADGLWAALGGLVMAFCFGGFAYVERLRQRRLSRPGAGERA